MVEVVGLASILMMFAIFCEINFQDITHYKWSFKNIFYRILLWQAVHNDIDGIVLNRLEC